MFCHYIWSEMALVAEEVVATVDEDSHQFPSYFRFNINNLKLTSFIFQTANG